LFETRRHLFHALEPSFLYFRQGTLRFLGFQLFDLSRNPLLHLLAFGFPFGRR